MRETFATAFLTILCSVLAGVIAAGYAWTHAPEIGGQLWPYIRVLVALGAALIGFKIGALVSLLVVLLGLVIAGFISWVVRV